MEPLAPIPTPPAQRWREFRIQALPVVFDDRQGLVRIDVGVAMPRKVLAARRDSAALQAASMFGIRSASDVVW